MILKFTIYFFFILLFITKWKFNFFNFPLFYPFYFLLFLLGLKNIKTIDKRIFKINILLLLFVIIILASYLLNLQPLSLKSDKFYHGFIFYCITFLFSGVVLNLLYNNSYRFNYIIILRNSLLFLAILSLFDTYNTYLNNTNLFEFDNFLISSSDIALNNFSLSGFILTRIDTFFGDPSLGALTFLLGTILNDLSNSKFKLFYSFIFIFSILMTMSVSGILCLFLYYFISNKFKYKNLFFIVLFFLIISYFSGLQPLIYDIILERTNSTGTFKNHLDINNASFDIILNNIFGLGYKSFHIHYPMIYSAHNSFLQVLLETGIFGLFFWLYLYYKILFEFAEKNQIYNVLFSFVIILFIMSFAHDVLFRFEYFLSVLLILIVNLNNHKLNS